MKKPHGLTIENKILFPFVLINLITVAAFFFIFYNTEYRIKVDTETAAAQELVDYITADIDGGTWEQPDELLEKYERISRSSNLFIYDASGAELFSCRELGSDELVLARSDDNRLGWDIVCRLDQRALRMLFIEEQRYLILAALAMLLIIVQSSVLIAYNISSPIRELSELCTRISRVPPQSEELAGEYIHRRDEVGQLAVAFQSMMDSLRSYTDELTWIKALNESIVENLPLGVVVYNEDRQRIFRNARADAMLSMTNERDAQGHDLRALLDDMMRREEVLPAPARLRDENDRVRDYEFGAWKLRYADGTERGTLYTIDDVTYQKHMEEKLSRDEKLAYTGELAADVAHEARNPLAGIRAGLQVISHKVDVEHDQLLCREMVREVDRVNLLIDNLVNLSRRRESEKTTVNLSSLCQEMAMLYSKVAENKGVSFSIEIEGELWLFVDEQELRQMLINLINNSIKAISPGGRVMLIGRRSSDGVSVIVADNGGGIDPAAWARALRGEGNGLGLPIVARLAAQNGGSIRMESVPGQGTQVILTFHGTGGER